jgi:hypothetical protein
MANKNTNVFANEGYAKFLDELLNREGETELGSGRWSAMAASQIRQKNIKTS